MTKTSNRDVLDAILRNEFHAFLQAMFSVYSPGEEFIPGSYIDAIAYHLSEVAAGRIKRLIINMPPRYLKSYCASVAFPAWVLGRDPTQQIICVSYSSDLSRKHSNDFRAIAQSPRYRSLFPKMRISRLKNNEFEVETSQRGFRLSTSVDGTVTGRGGNIIIIDDPISAADANSIPAITKIGEWFKSTIYSRLNNKETGAIIVVMQRLHVEDLAGELIQTGGWTLLNLPAVATEEQIVPIGPARVMQRSIGDVLHPERESRETLDGIKRTLGERVFSAQYLQAPLPIDGQAINVNWFGVYDQLPKRDEDTYVFQSWDTASKTGSQNDFSVGITFQKQRKYYYIIDVVRRRMSFPALREAAVEMARRYNAHAVVIEDAGSGIQLLQELRNTGVLRPKSFKVTSDKRNRVYLCEGILESGCVLLPRDAPWLSAFKQELASFPSRFDDQVDALTTGLLWSAQRSRQEVVLCAPMSVGKADLGPQFGGDYSEMDSFRPQSLSLSDLRGSHYEGHVTAVGLGSALEDFDEY